MDARAGEVGDADAGFAFVPPPRFAVARQGGRFLLSSGEDPGVLLVAPHDAPDAAALAARLAEGWIEERLELRALAPPGLDLDGVRAELAGRLDAEAARALALGSLRPGGGGVLALALATAGHWEPRRYDAFVRMIVRSLRWAGDGAPAADPLAELRAWLTGRVLVRLGAPSAAGVFATWAARQELRLHADGRFESLGLPGAAGRAATGRWRLLRAGGGAALELLDDDGGVAQLRVELGPEGTLLDGRSFHAAD